MVPRWGWGDATDVRIGNSTVLSDQCSVLLANHGRRAILVALGPGRSGLEATVTPACDGDARLVRNSRRYRCQWIAVAPLLLSGFNVMA